MTALRACIDTPGSARRALGRAGAFAEVLDRALPGGDPSLAATLYAAELTGSSVVLGVHQHAAHCLIDRAGPRAGEDLEPLRRTTGGASVFGGAGVLYVSLALRDASALIGCPPGKILNRYVRGMLAGLRSLGLPAHYFGRDFVSLDAEPVAYVAWEERASGIARLESFISFSRVFALPPELSAYPTPKEPRFRGRALTTVQQRAGKPVSASETLHAIVHGYAQVFGAQLEGPFDAEVLTEQQLEHAAHLSAAADVGEDLSGLHWSAPHEEVIGFVSAGVSLAPDGALCAVRLQGDFFMHASAASAIEERLIGQQPTADVFAHALDEVLAARAGLIEGVRSLRSLQSALLEATEIAQSARRTARAQLARD